MRFLFCGLPSLLAPEVGVGKLPREGISFSFPLLLRLDSPFGSRFSWSERPGLGVAEGYLEDCAFEGLLLMRAMAHPCSVQNV